MAAMSFSEWVRSNGGYGSRSEYSDYLGEEFRPYPLNVVRGYLRWETKTTQAGEDPNRFDIFRGGWLAACAAMSTLLGKHQQLVSGIQS